MNDTCQCEERKKPINEREWELSTWLPYKVYGPNAGNYRHRLMINLHCRKCGRSWRNKNANSPMWKLIGINSVNFHRHPIVYRIDTKEFLKGGIDN